MFLNNLLGYYCPLLLGLVFCLLGGYPIVLALRHRRDKARSWGGAVFVLPIGLLVLFLILSGPSPGERTRYANVILHVQPSDVQSIVIAAIPNSQTSLVGEDVTITDTKQIASICKGLNAARTDHLSGNYQPIWHCEIRLVLSSGAYKCSVRKTWKGQCFISMALNKANVGEFRSDSLGQVLEFLPRNTTGATDSTSPAAE